MAELAFEEDDVTDGGGDAFSAAASSPAPDVFSQYASQAKAPDFEGAAQARKGFIDDKVKAIDAANNRAKPAEAAVNAAANNLQSFDPNSLTQWDSKKEREAHTTPPMEQFGSFAMIAALGMAAFTRSPFNASLNAMAGVMNGIKEADDQAYERDYAAWKANNDVMFKRYDILKGQFDNAMDLWKTKGEMGRQELQNTLTKYGLLEQRALLDYGMDDLFFQWADKHTKAMDGMRAASEKMETYNAVKNAVSAENASRVQNGLGVMTPAEELQFKANLTQPRTPDQQAFEKVWREYLGSPEGLKATPQEKSTFYNELKYNQRSGSVLQNLRLENYQERKAAKEAELGRPLTAEEDSALMRELQLAGSSGGRSSGMAGVKVATFEAMKAEEEKRLGRPLTPQETLAIQNKAFFKGENPTAARASDIVAQKKAEWQAANPGKEPTSADMLRWEQDAKRRGISDARRDALAGLMDKGVESLGAIDKIEQLLAAHNAISGVGGMVRRPAESMANILGVGSTAESEFRQQLAIVQSLAPRIINESTTRPLAAEEKKINEIAPGLSVWDSARNVVPRLRELKALLRTSIKGWESRYNGVWETPTDRNEPAMGGVRPPTATQSQPSGGESWRTAPLAR